MKRIIKKLISKRLFCKISYTKKVYNKIYRNKKRLHKLLNCFLMTKIYRGNYMGESLKKLFNKVKLDNPGQKDNFYYSIDIFKTVYRHNLILSNLSIDYKKILDNSLIDFREKIQNNKKEEYFYENEIKTVDSIEILINRIIYKLEKIECNKSIIENIKHIKDRKATSFYEALQRILFFNQLMWQTNHNLNGLGRLDLILFNYYTNDIQNNIITKEEAKELIKEFLCTLHKYYDFKSSALLGDTGQIIELGGKDINGEYQYNELTYIFIETLEELQLPDPKILLRVSKNVPRDLIEQSLKCIQTGIGCPLFANDDVIIPNLIQFGYKDEDAYNYGTSACWEPFIIGKSLDQNNIDKIIFMQPFEQLLDNEDLDKIKNEQELISTYEQYAQKYIENLIEKNNKNILEEDSILSLLTDNCIERNKDISVGGAVYNNYGFTGVGLANLVNSIINIDKLVFKSKKYTFKQLNEIRKENFNNNDNLIRIMKNELQKYGKDDKEIIKLTNEIIKIITKSMEKYKNPLGGKYKFGLSSPDYISSSKKFPASFDGRRDGQPFEVHISCDSSNAYTELIQFASQIDYSENRFNGNVVDFFVSPYFIIDNFEKFVDFLMSSIRIGFFEMQMNVVSSETLIEARKNPEKFPNLIVRVWGFSAYFKDLPDDYKDYIIERALKSEKKI